MKRSESFRYLSVAVVTSGIYIHIYIRFDWHRIQECLGFTSLYVLVVLSLRVQYDLP